MIRILLLFLLPVTLFIGCTKDSHQETVQANICSATGVPQDTILHNGTSYYIHALFGPNNSIGTELIYIGTCANNLAIDYLQAIRGTNCFESNQVTTLLPPQYKAYSFGIFPSWAMDTATVCIVKITLDSTIYFLRDPALNM